MISTAEPYRASKVDVDVICHPCFLLYFLSAPCQGRWKNPAHWKEARAQKHADPWRPH